MQQRQEPFVEWVRDLFEADIVRLLLSTLIILSVLPFEWVDQFSMLFFGVFAIELVLRVIVLRSELRQRSINRTEIVILVLDVVATLSFLPLQSVVGDIRMLRLVRLTRMLMLLSYWRSVMREIWYIVIKRERRYQLIFVASLVVLLTFSAGILLAHFPPDSFDFNGDGKKGNETFWTMVWWSFRQLQDPGNLMSDPAPTLVFVFSLVLTISGVFMIAFFIGIGASIVEELVQLGRQRRIGAFGHSLVCNVGPHSSVLIDELVSYYAKSFRKPRLVAMGRSAERFDYLYHDRLRGVEYRQGLPLSEHDLGKVDADRANRVILLGDHSSGETADSAVVSQILSVREANRSCWIYGELQHSENVEATINAGGGEQTVPILARRFVALFLADLMVSPGLKRIYEQLLTPAGSEIYTCAFGIGQLASTTPPSARLAAFGDLLLGARRTSGVTLLGYLAADSTAPTGFAHVINPGPKSPFPAVPEVDQLRGFFGVARNFEQMKAFCLSLQDASAVKGEAKGAEVPSLALRPTQRKVSQILVCGYHDGLVDFCGQLLLFSPGVRIFVMVPDRMRAGRLHAAFLAATSQARWAGDERIFFRQGPEDGDLEVIIGDHPGGMVRIIAADWSDERVLVQRSEWDYHLSETDAVLLTHTDGDDDPDARTALALLKLLHLCQGRGPEDRCLRLICAVRNTEKARLFERRFGQISCDRRCKHPERCPRHTVTIVATEQLRHSFLAQGVLVPGISGIYDELLSKPGNEIYRLAVDEVGDDEAVVSFDDLLADLYARRRLVLIAVELASENIEEPEAPSIVINPGRRSSSYRFAAGRLRGLFAVGKLE